MIATCGSCGSDAIAAVAYVSNIDVPPLDGPPRAILSTSLPRYGYRVRSIAIVAEAGIMARSTIISTLLENIRPARSSMVSYSTDESRPVNQRADGTFRALPPSPSRPAACLASDAIAGVTNCDDLHMATSMPSTETRSYRALKRVETGSLAILSSSSKSR